LDHWSHLREKLEEEEDRQLVINEAGFFSFFLLDRTEMLMYKISASNHTQKSSLTVVPELEILPQQYASFFIQIYL